MGEQVNDGVEYLKNPEVAAMVAAGRVYQKSAKTGLRLPSADELGTEFVTYVRDSATGGTRVESRTPVTEDSVLARNLQPIGTDGAGAPVYNEWPIGRATVAKNYGAAVLESLTGDFSEHRKSATVTAVEIDDAMLARVGAPDGTVRIRVDWSPEPMVAHKGDFLTSGGYSISAHDMRDYVEVSQAPALADIRGKLAGKGSDGPKATPSVRM